MSDLSLVEVTVTVPDLDAAVAAWGAGVGLEAVIEPSTRRARIDVQGIAIVLVEDASEASGSLSGVTLGVDDLAQLRGVLSDITMEGAGGLVLDPGSTSGASITIVESKPA